MPAIHIGPGPRPAQEVGLQITTAGRLRAGARVSTGSDGTRGSVTRNLFRTRVSNGILGSFEFDMNGDTTAGGVTLNRIENGKPRVLDVITPPSSLR